MKEKASWHDFIVQLLRNMQNAKDIEIINKRADYLNKEAADVLEYQVIIGRKRNVEA